MHAAHGPTPYRGYCQLMWECEGGSTLCFLLFNILVISLLLFLVVDGCLAITCKLLHIPLTSFGRAIKSDKASVYPIECALRS